MLWAGLIALLVVLTGLSYGVLGTPQSWRSVPLSQQVEIQGTTPAQWAEQTRLWEQTTQTQPDNPKAWLMLARLHAAQNEYALAEQSLARVLALSPEPDLWLERAQMKALSAGGMYAGEPWQWIEKVLHEQPKHLNALVLAGSAALSEQRLPQAQAYWQQALHLVPEGSEAAQDLQKALAQLSAQASAQVARALPHKGEQAAAQPSDTRPLIQGEVRLSAEAQSQWRARECPSKSSTSTRPPPHTARRSSSVRRRLPPILLRSSPGVRLLRTIILIFDTSARCSSPAVQQTRTTTLP
jgi:cytochrome c-type biogenesis protein CcmH